MLGIKKKNSVKCRSITVVALIILSIIFTVVCKDSKAYAETKNKIYYVSTKGSDINEGTIDQPFNTIKRAMNKMQPGDTIVIREGVYHEAVEIYQKRGSADAWYTIKNYPGETVTMTGDYKLNINGMNDPDAITFRESSYWKVDGIKITQYTGAGIYVTDKCNYIEMSNLTIWDIDYPTYRPYGTSGIDGANSSNCTVKNCHIYNIGLKVDKPKDHGIYIGYSCDNWIFDGNNIHDNSGAGIQMYGNPNGGSNCTVVNNKLYNNHAYGLAIGSNATNNYVNNNLFYGNIFCDVYMLENSKNNWFKNNLFLTGYSNYNIQLADEQSLSNSFNYNTYYKADGNVASRYNQILNFEQWKSYGQEGSGKYIHEPDEAQKVTEKWIPMNTKKYTSKRLSGSDRFGTAASIATEFNNEKINSVLITSGYKFTNALSGSVLAKKLNSPILLSGKTDLENLPSVQYIEKHLDKNGKIYILGNEFNENESIITNLKNLGYGNINILKDGEQFGAIKAINDEINAPEGTPVVVASGNAFPDGLSISAVAASKGYPIILSDVYGLPSESEETLKKIKPSKIYIIGGSSVISDTLKNKIKKISGTSEDNIVRIWGEDRYSTSLNIAKYFKMDGSQITLASGLDFPDALAGSVLSAKLNSPLILIGDNNNEQKRFIDLGQYTNQIILGGTASISYNTQVDLGR